MLINPQLVMTNRRFLQLHHHLAFFLQGFNARSHINLKSQRLCTIRALRPNGNETGIVKEQSNDVDGQEVHTSVYCNSFTFRFKLFFFFKFYATFCGLVGRKSKPIKTRRACLKPIYQAPTPVCHFRAQQLLVSNLVFSHFGNYSPVLLPINNWKPPNLSCSVPWKSKFLDLHCSPTKKQRTMIVVVFTNGGCGVWRRRQ